ncbi:hypothetical protein Y032_0023g788 [Ancylostoma ceylanicum]|uniref:VWFA domain-containing protein n=3 Tax=Ancylostoma ceylanicum TaxID=53326 RepID=A0A016UY32_9BILA|nr:hypothetical protein Y032_0023g788 [Ancylostoma ceylanicum]
MACHMHIYSAIHACQTCSREPNTLPSMEHPVVVVLLLAGLAICFDTGESEAEGVTLQPENAIETTTSLPSSTEPQSLPAATSKTGQIIGEKEKVFVDPSNSECPCTPVNIWLDVFFLLDSSSAMTTSGFQYITAYVESVLYRMSVGLADGQQTRVGFITYGTNATLHYNLSHWESSNELLNYMNLSLQSSVGTNIEAAIRLANDNFVLPHHRPNARKVIVIIASAFEVRLSKDHPASWEQLQSPLSFYHMTLSRLIHGRL